MDWDDLRYFLAIARHGSLSAAAKTLKVTQSTMSRRLEALEQRMGAKLLQKTPSGYVLTAVGVAVLGNVERIEGEALAVERVITGRDVRLEGTIRVTMVETLAVEVLSESFAAFRLKYPGIQLDLITDTRNLSLTMREADIALRLTRLTQNDLAVRRVATLGFGLYVGATYLDRRGQPDFATGGDGHDILITTDDLAGTPDSAWFRTLLPKATIAFRSNSRYALRAAAEAGMGLVCLAHYLVDRTPLIRLDPPRPPPLREVWLAVHNDIRHTPRIRALTDFLTASLTENRAVLNPDDPCVGGHPAI
ncbi:MAG TPA: LysR family transcriptional regulator [Stellaceae bacterium]|nr:LysR family transcriptional regulator [Stellaceae bacterium]